MESEIDRSVHFSTVTPCVGISPGLKPPKSIPFRLTWDKSLFLKHRRQALKSVLEELDFHKPVRLEERGHSLCLLSGAVE